MRIIAGTLGGQTFQAPKGHRTHPMSDKARGAIFNALGDISGQTVLDGFCGSGALSIEAISRGADHANAVDADLGATKTTSENAKKLRIESKIKVTRANISTWSDNNADLQFDLVFADPPYDHLQIKTLEKLSRHTKPSGLFILSWPGKLELPAIQEFVMIKSKSYGDAQIAYYKPV